MSQMVLLQDDLTIKPDGPAQGQLSQVFLEEFSYGTLDLFIKYRLGLNPSTIYAPPDELPTRINSLFDEVDRRHVWTSLLLEASGYRPGSRSLARQCALMLKVSEDELEHRVRERQMYQSLAHGFPEAEAADLRDMLWTELNRDLDAIAGPDGPYPDRLAKVVRQADKEGWLADLARAAYLHRPYDLVLKSFLDNFYPELAGERHETGQRVQSGLVALLEIMRHNRLPDLQQLLRPRLQDFETTLSLLERLNKYKGLHAQLHTLQLSLPATQYALEHGQGGRQYSRPIREYVKVARHYASGLPTEKNEGVWIDSLEWAAKQIDEVGKPGAQVSIPLLVSKLLAAPTEAPRISERIATIAVDIPLARIAAVFAEVKKAMGDAGLGGAGTEEFFTGSALLRQLVPWLKKLTDEHFEWQMLDKHLQAAGSMTGNKLEERIPRWEDEVGPALRILCAVNPSAIWAQELMRAIDQLERPGDDPGLGDFEGRLDTLQERASNRFIEVDDELLQGSEELTKIIGPLNQLVGLISQ